MGLKYFTINTEHNEAIKKMTDKQRSDLFLALSEYATNGTEPTAEDAVVQISFSFMRGGVDNAQRRMEAKGTASTAKRKRGAPKGNKNACKNKKKPSETATENESKKKPVGAALPKPDYQTVMNYWNGKIETTGSRMCRITRMTASRKTAVAARFRECGNSMAKLYEAIDNAVTSDFLNGANRSSWVGSFDWLMSPEHFQRALEGNYANGGKSRAKPVAVQPQQSTISAQIEEQHRRQQAPETGADTELKKQLEGWVRLVNKNPRSSCRKALEEYERRGELRRLGVV